MADDSPVIESKSWSSSNNWSDQLRRGLHLAFGARRRLDVQNEMDA